MFSKLSNEVKAVFNKTVKELSAKNTLFVMTAFYPQRGGILQDVVKAGGQAVIAGGAPNQQLFTDIPQYSPGYDTTGISETRKKYTKSSKRFRKNLSAAALSLYSSKPRSATSGLII